VVLFVKEWLYTGNPCELTHCVSYHPRPPALGFLSVPTHRTKDIKFEISMHLRWFNPVSFDRYNFHLALN